MSTFAKLNACKEKIHVGNRHLENALVLLDPLKGLLEIGVDASHWGTCRVGTGLLFVCVLLEKRSFQE